MALIHKTCISVSISNRLFKSSACTDNVQTRSAITTQYTLLSENTNLLFIF